MNIENYRKWILEREQLKQDALMEAMRHSKILKDLRKELASFPCDTQFTDAELYEHLYVIHDMDVHPDFRAHRRRLDTFHAEKMKK